MNMDRSYLHFGRRLAAVLGLVSAASLAQAQGAGDAGGAAPAPPAAAEPAPAAPAAITATAKAPATVLVDRQAAGNGAFLDLNVRAFKPPRHGAVEAVVTLEENKDGGREVDVGSFAIFPAKKFEAKKPDDERGFRFDATQALADLGGDSTAVKVRVRLAPLREGQSASGAKLTLGRVQLVPREDPK